MDSATTSPAGVGPTLAPPARAGAPLAPTRVQVTGPLHGLRMPDACAACGTPARGTLRVEKMFRRTYSEAPSRWFFAALDVPFCEACRAAHARELTPVDRAMLGKLRWRFVGRILPYVIPIAVILWMIPKALAPLMREVTRESMGLRTADGVWNYGLLFGVGIVAFFAMCLCWFLVLVNRARHDLTAAYAGDPDDTYIRRERVLFGRNAVFPGPPTSVLAAVNYTDDESELFEPDRRTYTFRDPVFAAQFAALNANRLWNAKAPRARWARKARNFLMIAFVVALAVVWVVDWWMS